MTIMEEVYTVALKDIVFEYQEYKITYNSQGWSDSKYYPTYSPTYFRKKTSEFSYW